MWEGRARAWPLIFWKRVSWHRRLNIILHPQSGLVQHAMHLIPLMFGRLHHHPRAMWWSWYCCKSDLLPCSGGYMGCNYFAKICWGSVWRRLEKAQAHTLIPWNLPHCLIHVVWGRRLWQCPCWTMRSGRRVNKSPSQTCALPKCGVFFWCLPTFFPYRRVA